MLLVIGLRSGCLNHARLKVEAIRARGLRLAGWVGNQVDPDMLARDRNIATLAALVDAPNLGVVPWIHDPRPELIADHLRIEPLLQTPQGPCTNCPVLLWNSGFRPNCLREPVTSRLCADIVLGDRSIRFFRSEPLWVVLAP